jgi:saccharopine dehydrogenase-like NADP-dependent oxidoreductase
MRIVVLGGAGDMGSAAVMDLVNNGVEEVVVADYDLERKKKVAKQYKGQKSKVSALFVDANNHKSLIDVMKGADAVASAIGPFYKYGAKILKTAIDAEVNFVDINDDYDATRGSLELNDQAERAGTTAIIGLGASPGITNMLAKLGANKLDRVDEIHTFWSVPLGEEGEGGSAATDHWFHIITGRVPTYRDGKWVDVLAGSEPEIVDFPPEIEVFNVGHPEPVTLPRYIAGVKVVTSKGGLTPAWINQVFFNLVAFGFNSTKPLKVKGTSVVPKDFTLALLEAVPDFAPPETLTRIVEDLSETEAVGGLRVDVNGEKDGNPTRLIYRLRVAGPEMATMSTSTGIPLSIGAQMLARGEIKAKGVFAPEGCIDPEAFLAELKKRGAVLYETAE